MPKGNDWCYDSAAAPMHTTAFTPVVLVALCLPPNWTFGTLPWWWCHISRLLKTRAIYSTRTMMPKKQFRAISARALWAEPNWQIYWYHYKIVGGSAPLVNLHPSDNVEHVSWYSYRYIAHLKFCRLNMANKVMVVSVTWCETRKLAWPSHQSKQLYNVRGLYFFPYNVRCSPRHIVYPLEWPLPTRRRLEDFSLPTLRFTACPVISRRVSHGLPSTTLVTFYISTRGTHGCLCR